MADDWEDRAFESEEENVKDKWDDDSEDEKPEVVANEKPQQNKLEKEKQNDENEDLLISSNVESEVTAGLRESIDTFEPTNYDDMERFKNLLKYKVARFSKSQHYVGFMEEMVKTLCKDVDLDSLKKISDSMSALSSEKSKQSKNIKSKKKVKKVTQQPPKEADLFEQVRVANNFNDFEDYL